MKLKKNNITKSVKNLFELKLIKNKVYTKDYMLIKNSLKVVFSYLVAHKKILFIGALNRIRLFYKTFVNRKNIVCVPQNLLQNGFFSNIYVFKNFCLHNKKDIFKFLFSNKTANFDLIVLFDKYKNNEIFKLNKIPSIFLCNLHSNNYSHYSLNDTKLAQKDSDIFYFFIRCLLNKYKK